MGSPRLVLPAHTESGDRRALVRALHFAPQIGISQYLRRSGRAAGVFYGRSLALADYSDLPAVICQMCGSARSVRCGDPAGSEAMGCWLLPKSCGTDCRPALAGNENRHPSEGYQVAATHRNNTTLIDTMGARLTGQHMLLPPVVYVPCGDAIQAGGLTVDLRPTRNGRI